MSGEILAEDNSPMFLTVGDYNQRVALTHEIATRDAIAAEQERIIKLFHISEEPWTLEELEALIKGEK